jgi:hypothetical protein
LSVVRPIADRGHKLSFATSMNCVFDSIATSAASPLFQTVRQLSLTVTSTPTLKVSVPAGDTVGLPPRTRQGAIDHNRHNVCLIKHNVRLFKDKKSGLVVCPNVAAL